MLKAGFIQVREKWTSQGKSENVFQSLESHGIIDSIHQFLGKVREIEHSWAENQNSAHNPLFFEAEKKRQK